MVLLAAAVALAACGGGAGDDGHRPPSGHRPPPGAGKAPPPQVEPGPWLTVDPAEEQRLEERTVYHQGPRQPPVTVRRVPVILPIEPQEVPERPLIVQIVLSDSGRVARARLLHAPPILGLEQGVLETRLVEALRRFRYQPARLDGEPVAVYYNITLEMAPEG